MTKGKKCGESYIPRGHKCSKGQAPEPVQEPSRFKQFATAAAIAGAGVGAAYVLKNKLSDADADRIIDEAVAGGQKWDVFESLKRRNCGTRSDAKTKARCRLGGGAYGDYYVHTSGEYGVKVNKEGDSQAVWYEARMLDHAHRAGVPVPELLAHRDTKIVMQHMKGYKTMEDVFGNPHSGALFGVDIPIETRLNYLGEVKKMHLAGIGHGDLHNENVLYNEAKGKFAIIDWGYSGTRDDRFGANLSNGASGGEIIMRDLAQLPRRIGLSEAQARTLRQRYNNALSKAVDEFDDDKYEFVVNRYYNDMERTLRGGKRSALQGEVIQGELKFTRPIVMSRTRNRGRNPRQREAMTNEVNLPKRNLKTRKLIPTKPQPFGTPMQPANTAKPALKTQTFVRKALAQNLINAHVPNAGPTERQMLLSQGVKVPHKQFKGILSSHNRFKAEVEGMFAKRGGATIAAARAAFRRRDRLDQKCGKSGIAKGKKCRKGLSPRARKVAIAAAGAGLTAAAVAAVLYGSKRGPSGSNFSVPKPPVLPGAPSGPKVSGLSPKALLPAAPPRKSKTQRMRENTAASIKVAERRIGQTAKEEVRRLAQIGNTMAAAGEASGNVVKTTMRELRLRAEAARRKYEPGYRKAKQERKQLMPGSLKLPVRNIVKAKQPMKRMDALTPNTVRLRVAAALF